MKIQIFSIFYFLFFIKRLFGLNKETLEIFPLGSHKNLLHFSFNFEELLDLDKITFNTNVWPRSILEMLLQRAKITDFKIQMANGRINPYFIDQQSFTFELPQSGTKVFINPESNYNLAINTLNEIFSFERKTILNENHFLIDLTSEKNVNNENILQGFKPFEKDFFLKKFLFSHSPDDFICVETLEKLREYVGCSGTKGIYSLLDLNKIFKSEYVSIAGYLNYMESSQKVKYGIEINTIIDYELRDDYFQTSNLEACMFYDEAKIISYQKRDEVYPVGYDLLEVKMMPFAYIPFIKTIENKIINPIFMKKQQLFVYKFIGQPVFSFENDIIYDIKTHEKSAKVIIFEYLPFYFLPKFHKITAYLNFTQIDNIYTYEIIQNAQSQILKFTINLPKNSVFSLKIPIKKLMKSFENYPHDSARGHPLIGTPVIYYLNNENNYWVEMTQSLLMRIPEPDFSMPFNISTYTFVLLGYFYLMIFKIVMGKDDSHWLIKKSDSLWSKFVNFFKK